MTNNVNNQATTKTKRYDNVMCLLGSEHQFGWSQVDDPQPWRAIEVQECVNRNCVYTKHHAKSCQDKPNSYVQL